MSSTVWVVDSGASAHFSVVREDFITLDLVDSGIFAGIYVCVRGHGTCQLTLIDPSGMKCIFILDKVMFVPDLAPRSNGNYCRLLSVPLATNRGCRFEFTQSGDKLWTLDGRLFDMIRSNGLVWLPTGKASMEPLRSALLSKQTDCDTIHKRCAHVSEETLKNISALGIKGIPENYCRGPRIFCRSSVVRKLTTADFNRGSTRDCDPESCFHTMLLTSGDQPVDRLSVTSRMSWLQYVSNLHLLWPNCLSVSLIHSKYFAVSSTGFNYSDIKYEYLE